MSSVLVSVIEEKRRVQKLSEVQEDRLGAGEKQLFFLPFLLKLISFHFLGTYFRQLCSREMEGLAGGQK